MWTLVYTMANMLEKTFVVDPVIRVNSQSGKGGVAYVLEQEYGLVLPRWLQVDFSPHVQRHAEASESEVSNEQIRQIFENTYLEVDGVMRVQSYQAARAQVMYDCWVEEQAENRQPDDIAYCRSEFLAAIALVEDALKPMAVQMPAADPMLAPKSWVVYFDFDKTDLSSQSQATIADAAAYAATSSQSLVVVEGHTDTAGPSDYNDGLAADRAEVVADRLREVGVALIYISPRLD